MNTKFLFVCSDDIERLPNEKSLAEAIKCSYAIELSRNLDEMVKKGKKTRYKAGPLERIYDTTCSHRSHYCAMAWGINTQNHVSPRNNKIFIMSDDAESEYLDWLILKDDFKLRAFSLDDNGIDEVNTWIECYKYLNDRFHYDYKSFVKERNLAMDMIGINISAELKKIFSDIEPYEISFLDTCKKNADLYMARVTQALTNGWS